MRSIRIIFVSFIRAIPDEVTAIGQMFRRGRDDYRRLREHVQKPHTLVIDRLRKRDWLALKLWNYVVFPSYQVADDIPGLAIFLLLKNTIGLTNAWLAVTLISTFVAAGVALIQRFIEVRKADFMRVQTIDDTTDRYHDLLDSSINSAPWGVLRHAHKRRHENDPIQLVTYKRIGEMSATYGVCNTAIYAAAGFVPGLNSWTSFVVMLLVMILIKGTVRGYRERSVAHSEELAQGA